MPKTVSARDIQRDYRSIFDGVKASREPVVVLTNNKPDVVIMDLGEAERLYKRAADAELAEAMEAVRVYKREKKQGQLKTLTSLSELM